MKKKLLALFVILAMVLSIVPAVYAEGASLAVQVTPSVSTAEVGDTVEYTVTATGDGITALQFDLVIPEGMTYVAGSAAVPETLKKQLGWAATDWTEESMMWTGYTDLPTAFPEGTVILTFSCTVDAAGEHEIVLERLWPFDENYGEVAPELTVGKVTVDGEPQAVYLDVTVEASATEVNAGETIDYTVYAVGNGITALQFDLVVPEGLTYVANSAAVPETLKKQLGWAATDWTEESMMWTGYTDLPTAFPAGTVILTFSCTATTGGTYEIALERLWPFDENYGEIVPSLTVDAVTVIPVGCEHSFTNYVSNNDATCTEDGTETATCDKCGEETDTRPVADSALGHSFGEYVANNNATCTEDGTETATCGKCGETDTRPVADSALGHNFGEYVSNNDATCTEDGTKTAACGRCDATDTVTDADTATGHKFTNYVPNGDAGCTTDGTKTAECDNDCGETDTVADPESATGHSFTNYVSNGDATCTENGTETATCDNCDATDTREDADSAIGHSLILVPATVTCTKDGNNAYYVCDNCDAMFADATGSIPTDEESIKAEALGHTDADGDKTCDVCGFYDGPFMNVTVKPSKTDAKIGDTVDFVVYAYGNQLTALQFYLTIPEGMTYVANSAAVPEALMGQLGWAATDWTEETMMWTGYTDVPTLIEDGTVILTFSCTVDAKGTYEVALDELLPFDPDFEEFAANVTVDAVEVTCDHSFTNYVSNNDATCTEDGTETAVCDKCDETDTRTVAGSALGHIDENDDDVCDRCEEDLATDEPTEPSDPTEPSKPSKPSTKPDTNVEEIPKTDNTGAMLYFAVMMAAAFAVLFTVLLGKKKFMA